MTRAIDSDIYRNDFVVFVPDNWTGEQAIAVHEFLETLATAIWDRYETEMLPIIVPDAREQQDATLPLILQIDDVERPDLDDDFLHDNEADIPF